MRHLTRDEVAYAGESPPDQILALPFKGSNVITYRFGLAPRVLLCISGGPGMPCDYIRDSHCALADENLSVVVCDQSGTGASGRPQDPSRWTLATYVDEVEAVHEALNCERLDLLGQSWGVWVAIEYCLRLPDRVDRLVLANGCADIPAHMVEMQRLKRELGAETVSMMGAHERSGTTSSPEYLAALAILDRMHICRLDAWPASLTRTIAGTNWDIYHSMWGANDYVCTGSLASWSRLADLHRIRQPTLVIHGEHDEFTPAEARQMHARLPDSRLVIIPESSHTPFFETPDAYFGAVSAFLSSGTTEG